MKRRTTGAHNRGICRLTYAFTLYELVITIALFSLVAGLVITYISFMATFNRDNSEIADRAAQVTDIRREVDYWFSYFDRADYSVTLVDEGTDGGEKTVAFAQPVAGGEKYELRLALLPDLADTDEPFVYTFVCEYPSDAGRGEVYVYADGSSSREKRVQCPAVYSVCFAAYNDNWQYSGTDEMKTVRFIVDMPVTGRLYACDILYS